jgi:hypothetical protein
MKAIFKELGQYVRTFMLEHRPKRHLKPVEQAVVDNNLSTIELAYSFNNAVNVFYQGKTSNESTMGMVSQYNDTQVIIKDLKSNQVKIIPVYKIKKVNFLPAEVKNTLLETQREKNQLTLL